MPKKSAFAPETRSMRISVQKYRERNQAPPPQRRDRQREPVAAAPEAAAPVAAAPAFWPVPADENEAGPSGNRDDRGRKPRIIISCTRKKPRDVPDAGVVEEYSGPACPRQNTADPPKNFENATERRNAAQEAAWLDGPAAPPSVPPAALPAAAAPEAPPAAPQQVDLVSSRNKAVPSVGGRNKLKAPGGLALYVPEARAWLYRGRGFKKNSYPVIYCVPLTARLLENEDVEEAERFSKTIPGGDFHMIADDGEHFPCVRELLRTMCRTFNHDWYWDMSSFSTCSDSGTTMNVVAFANKGSIQFGDDLSVIDALAVADYLGFDSLLKVCVFHMSLPSYSAERLIQMHALYDHVERMTEVFSQRLRSLPLKVFNPIIALKDCLNLDEGLLSSLCIKQMLILLQDDKLVVANEDQAVMFVVEWLKSQKLNDKVRQAELEDLCFAHIRYPFITRKLKRALEGNKLGLTKERIVNDDCQEGCKKRSAYEKHVHFIWNVFRGNKRGAQTIGLSCITWNRHTRKLEERNLTSIPHKPQDYEEHYSAQYTVIGNKLVKVARNRAHNRIFVSEVNLVRGTTTLKSTIRLTNERVVERPNPVILKNPSHLTVSYDDGGGIEITSLNLDTWERTRMSTQAFGRITPVPYECAIFDDCAVGLNYRNVIISNVDFTEPVEIGMPETDGKFVNLERVGDEIFVLEDNTSRRLVERDAPDLVHTIDIKTKKLVRTSSLPLYPEDQIYKFDNDYAADRTTKFLKIESELFVITQADRDKPLRIVSFDVRTSTSEIAAIIKAPQPDPDDPESVHARGFLCAVKLRVAACDKTTLREMADVPRQ